jgi:DNA-binding HxlR family transcriptional regulator
MVTFEYLHDGMKAAKKEEGTFGLGTKVEVTVKNGTKSKATTPALLMCKSEETKPLREFLARVGDKWSILLAVTLANVPKHRARFSELQRMVEGISQRMLATTLRQMERDGLLTREVFPEVPPRVEYELTDLGLSLLVPMRNLVQWIGNNWDSIKKARACFDRRSQ